MRAKMLLRAARRCDTARATGASTAAMRARSAAAAVRWSFAVRSVMVCFRCVVLASGCSVAHV